MIRPTRCTAGIVALVFVLVFFAYLTDDIPAVLAAGSLVFFLALRAVTTLFAARDIAGSLTIEREPAYLFVRQGSVVPVTLSATLTLPAGTAATLTDLAPASAPATGGEPFVRLDPGRDSSRTVTMHYTIRCMASGEQVFGGIRLAVADPFFTGGFLLENERFCIPAIRVFPLPQDLLTGDDAYGDMDVPRITPLRGYGIRSFRKYLFGDDPKTIDWKLSAKHDTLYVRDFMGRESAGSLIVVDVPDRAVSFPAGDFARLREAAAGAAAATLRQQKECDILVVSGGNIIRFLPAGGEQDALMAFLRSLEPQDRMVRFFRHPGLLARPPILAAAPGSDGEAAAHRITTLRKKAAAARRMTPFERQIARVLHAVRGTDVAIFSLFDGDTSHIGMIAGQADLLSKETVLHVPAAAATPSLRRRARGCGISGVEVVPA
ncbi:MAG: DUF58 domain-containing protein [Methanomicrobiaceae archaeon]|nr:DUF58 domain-containing protein [Methanomicrobiaceae archaeon]